MALESQDPDVNCSGVKDQDSCLDGGDATFTNLLRQLARLHRGCLVELQTLRAENESLSQRPHGFLHQTALADMKTPSNTDNGSGHSYESHAKVGAPPAHTEIPLPSEEPPALPGVLADMHESHDMPGVLTETCDMPREVKSTRFSESMTTVDIEANDNGHQVMESHDSEEYDDSMRVFELRQNWNCSDSKLKKGETSLNFSIGQNVADELGQETLPDAANGYNGFLRHIIVYPASPKRIVWDLTGAIFIFWDLVIMPLNLSSLTPESSVFLDAMDWMTSIFWTLNVLASVLVGYVQEGVTVMDPIKILLHYLKTWFVLDLVVVLPDWVFTLTKLSGDNSDGGGSVRILRILRLARCMRLFRLAKLKAILSLINDLINSEYTNIVLNIVKMLIGLVAINHWVGCMWFLTADSQDTNTTWIKFHGFDEEDLLYKYLTSFHWAITQFTPSSMHVQPQNTLERAFAVTIIVFGLVVFAYLVGSITGSLTELRKMNADTSKLFWNLRRYLNQKKVPTELSVRIQKYLEHKWQSQKVTVSQDSVSILKLLSEQLINELQRVISVPHMVVHPLFKHLNTESCITMQRLAKNAISTKQLANGDSLFFPMEQATDMSFVVDGRLQYIRMLDSSKEWVDKDEDWISEPILWTEQWHHRGELIAVCPSDLLMINAAVFGDIIKRNPQVHKFVNAYAAHFIKWINSMERPSLSDITQGELSAEKIKSLMVPGRTSLESIKRTSGLSVGTSKGRSSTKMLRPTFMDIFPPG